MLILETLARMGPMQGYGIARRIQQLSQVLVVEEGSLYPARQRMRMKGWLTSEWKRSEDNRRARSTGWTQATRSGIGGIRAGDGGDGKVIRPA